MEIKELAAQGKGNGGCQGRISGLETDGTSA